MWTLNRVTLGSVRKLKDADKNYVWMPGLANGVPNTILGAPYVECPDMPNEGADAFPMALRVGRTQPLAAASAQFHKALAVKGWISGTRGPSGLHLVLLMACSDAVHGAVLKVSGRDRSPRGRQIAKLKSVVSEAAKLLDEIDR